MAQNDFGHSYELSDMASNSPLGGTELLEVEWMPFVAYTNELWYTQE